ncbi:glycosyltransferase family 4 protein [Asticcacaulis sp. EMRT-3]|uniref:glycosyltransferase family 4 protein n=1 Tax=Asticcacaulis sp. EMRT-3 TaxID=3040349 RepID=UPI0024AFF76D|nr:glycosyltransferase family 4 protein [Asticcacaulis sp. EMRT-3]MDI7775958.1 glycosyltransferase family 4 protein [Asticcacaulis sp. EMRT-3]
MLQANSFEVAHEDVSLRDISGLLPPPEVKTCIKRPAIIGNFPPRQCGLATFTRDMYSCLSAALPKAHWNVIAINDPGAAYAYPDDVTHQLPQNDAQAYRALADTLNSDGTDILFVQHEFGIYGGPSGAYLIGLLERLSMPIITTLHTILENPNPEQRRVMRELIRLSATLVTMAEKGAEILRRIYGVPSSQISVVPHGAPSRPIHDTDDFKDRLNLSGRKTLTTFGLLSPNKGIETIIAALPELIKTCPEIVYLVIGVTHPHLIRAEGEAYRDKLKVMARELGVSGHVRFINRFINDNDLIDILQASDVYVTPYLTETQITSGTLAYALALGRPVVSTPYWHAKEALADGVGILCPFGDTEAFTTAIARLMSSDKIRAAMTKRAYEAARPSRWSAVAQAYVARAEAAILTPRVTHEALPEALKTAPSWAAIARMSDDCGIFQHGKYRLPDRQHGYCADDNARALSWVARASHLAPLTPDQTALAYRYAAFMNHAWNPDGRFRNFMSYGRQWLDDGGSDDCCARSYESLVDVARSNLPADLRQWATELGSRVIVHAAAWPSLRARAVMIKALARSFGVIGDGQFIQATARDLCLSLHGSLKAHAGGQKVWFDESLSYDNGRLSEGLIIGGHFLAEADMISDGLASLHYLMTRQTAPDGCFLPVPTSHFCEDGQAHPIYDQQPLEVLATIDACLSAARLTGDLHWKDEAIRAFNWFLGDNTQGLSLLDGEGGCYDGLTPHGCNENQGAESLLAYPLSWAALKKDLL